MTWALNSEFDKSLFITRLREVRVLRGLSQTELGAMIDGTQMTISYIEAHGRMPRLDKVYALCRALDVSSDYLLGLTNEPFPS